MEEQDGPETMYSLETYCLRGDKENAVRIMKTHVFIEDAFFDALEGASAEVDDSNPDSEKIMETLWAVYELAPQDLQNRMDLNYGDVHRIAMCFDHINTNIKNYFKK